MPANGSVRLRAAFQSVTLWLSVIVNSLARFFVILFSIIECPSTEAGQRLTIRLACIDTSSYLSFDRLEVGQSV